VQRKLKPDARPVADPDDPRTVVSAADVSCSLDRALSTHCSVSTAGRGRIAAGSDGCGKDAH